MCINANADASQLTTCHARNRVGLGLHRFQRRGHDPSVTRRAMNVGTSQAIAPASWSDQEVVHPTILPVHSSLRNAVTYLIAHLSGLEQFGEREDYSLY